MPRIDIELPPHVTPEEAQKVKKVLESQLNDRWEIFKYNAQEFFRSLRDLLGSIWDKIASWARRVWEHLFG